MREILDKVRIVPAIPQPSIKNWESPFPGQLISNLPLANPFQPINWPWEIWFSMGLVS